MNLLLKNTFIEGLVLQREKRHFHAHLCIAPLSLSDLKSTRSLFLHGNENSYFNKLEFERRQHSYLLGRYCAKSVLSKYLNEEDFTSIFIRRGVFDYPVVNYSAAHDAQVSIAHSSFWGAAIASSQEHPMAIDIEQIDSQNNAVVESQLTDREKQLVDPNIMPKEKQSAFFWALKEAISKAIKCGMTTPFQVYEIESIAFEQDYAVATFKNFGQYKGIVFSIMNMACAVVLPKKTKLEINFCLLNAFFANRQTHLKLCNEV